MMQGVGKGGAAAAEVERAGQVVNTPLSSGGAVRTGGGLANEKDATESARAEKFGDLYKEIQSKYGAKQEKPREVKKTLGKDDFLKIMITQMRNQDPTNPFKAEQMATEMAQFTSVEQLQNVNQNLNKMANQNRPLEQMAMTNMIGKIVTIDRERFPHLEGESEFLSFKLSKNAADVKVAIISEAGETVLEKGLGSQKSGDVSYTWDGIKSNSLLAKGGSFLFRVTAKDEQGRTIETNPKVQAKVIGISFEGQEPVFLVGDAKHQDKITMKNIVQVDLEGAATKSAQPAKEPKFQSESPSPEKIANLAPKLPNVPAAPAALPSGILEEKGFPNGLQEMNLNQNGVKKGGEKG